MGGWRDVCLDTDGWVDGEMYVWIQIDGWMERIIFEYE